MESDPRLLALDALIENSRNSLQAIHSFLGQQHIFRDWQAEPELWNTVTGLHDLAKGLEVKLQHLSDLLKEAPETRQNELSKLLGAVSELLQEVTESVAPEVDDCTGAALLGVWWEDLDDVDPVLGKAADFVIRMAAKLIESGGYKPDGSMLYEVTIKQKQLDNLCQYLPVGDHYYAKLSRLCQLIRDTRKVCGNDRD